MDYSKKIKKKNTVQAKPGDYRNIAKPVKNNAAPGSQKAATKPISTPAQSRNAAAAKKPLGQTRQRPVPDATRKIDTTAQRRQAANQKQPQTRKPAPQPRRQPTTATNSRPRPSTPARTPSQAPQKRQPAARMSNAAPGINGVKPKKHMSRFKKRLITTLIVIIVGFIGYAAIAILGNLNPDLNSSDLSKYGISSNAAAVAKSHRIVNIAVFGIDAREDVEGERSDSTMIATLDLEHGSIKITSLMRDTYVYVSDENDFDKLNAAYSLGGADGALKTINTNFDTAITDYVTIDFTSMVKIVNAVGGVTVNIESEDELYWLNQYLGDVNDKVGTNSPAVAGTGQQVLDGSQALAYCRIRYVGNGDFDRTQRQRTVFQQAITKAMDLNPLAQYALIQAVMPYVKTSLSSNEILKYAGNVMLMRSKSIQQNQIPDDNFVETGYLDDVSYVFPVTLVDNIKSLYTFIYGVDYTPSTTAQKISREIQSVW